MSKDPTDRPHTELRRGKRKSDEKAETDKSETEKAKSEQSKKGERPSPRSKTIPSDGRDIDGDDPFNDMPV